MEWFLGLFFPFIAVLIWIRIIFGSFGSASETKTNVEEVLAALSTAWPKLSDAQIITLYVILFEDPKGPNTAYVQSDELLLKMVHHIRFASSSAKHAQVMAFLVNIPK